MSQQDHDEGTGGVLRGELVPAAPGSMREWAERLVARAREDGLALTGEGGLLTDLMRNVLQTGLEVEMAEHLGYERGAAPPGGVGNARNGAYDKTVTPGVVARVDELRALCARHGVPLPAAAVQFPARHPVVTSVLVGCRTADEVVEDVRLFRLAIPTALWDELA